jgi:hypothetical protein
MILTSHRLDCLKIALNLLAKSDAFNVFDRVVFLLNGVKGKHLRYVEDYMAAHPEVAWDTVAGPRGRSECISSLENQCVEKYPGNVYVKMDEDIFPSHDWASRMMEAYEAHKEEDDLALITPLIPNNSFGLHTLLTEFYPSLLEEHRRLFGKDPSPDAHSMTWGDPRVAEWGMRQFIELEKANAEHRKLTAGMDAYERYRRFSCLFSIGCICWDYRHWEKMGGVPAKDEPEWCAWIEENGQRNVLDTSHIVQHYSFFVQQDWLDRGTFLEDFQLLNTPELLPGKGLAYHLPRWVRVMKQGPRVLRRRLSHGK